MNKAIKITLFCGLGLPLIVVSALLSVFFLKDANDFKPIIEEQAKLHIGLNLKIEDQLSWSLIPIGLEVHQLSILDQNQAHFASADKIVASIDFWSLFQGSPKVETILLDGLKLALIETSDTENNWSNILPPKAPKQAEQTTQTKTTTASSKSENDLNFLIESLELSNTQIRFESIPKSLDLNIKPLDLSITQITLGETFPLSLSYALSETANQLSIESSLNATLFASKDLSQFRLSEVSNHYEIRAANVSSKPIKLNVKSDLEIDTTTESVSVSNLLISLNNFAIQGQAKVKDYGSASSVESEIKVPEFSLKSLLTSLDIEPPTMQQQQALEKVSLSSSINLNENLLTLSGLNINLDKSNWQGEISHSLDTAASKLRFKGDSIRLDDYLPPENQSTKSDASTQDQLIESNTNQSEIANAKPLLPIEMLQKLNLDFKLEQNSLHLSDIETTSIVLALTAKEGKLLHTLTGNIFEGNYTSKSTLNIKNKTPQWNSEQTITDLNLAPIFDRLNIEALKEYGKIAGLLNFNANTKLTGNDIASLKTSASSHIEFDIDKGAFEGLSLNALTCKGFAVINKETVDTSNWPQETPFNTLKGSASLKNEILSTRFDLITSGVHADSTGSINVAQNSVDILASLKVIGELGDNACRVNEKVSKLGIPVKCQGSFDTPPAELCTLDTSRLADMAKNLAIEEGKRKASKELDRALDKHLGDKKEPIKSLLNKFLK